MKAEFNTKGKELCKGCGWGHDTTKSYDIIAFAKDDMMRKDDKNQNPYMESNILLNIMERQNGLVMNF
jgi:hypothetical protein